MWRYPAGDRDRFSLGWALEMVRGKVRELGVGVGVVVSTVKVTVLLASFSSLLLLPAEFENLSLATWMTPLVVLLSVGVKVAV